MTLYNEQFFVDRDPECRGFAKLLQPETPQAGMLLTADEKMGKSWLIDRLYSQSQAVAADAPRVLLDFRHPREKYQMQDALGLMRLIRDKIGRPSYFVRLNATISRFIGVTQSSNISALQQLADAVCDYFNMEELKGLARDLGLDPENLPHDVKPAFAYELVSYHARRSLLPNLIGKLQAVRPNVGAAWQGYLDNIVKAGQLADASGSELGADPGGVPVFSSDKERQNAEYEISTAFFACLTDLLADQTAGILLIDHYEEASPEAERWMREQLLTSLRDEKLNKLVIVVSGRQVPQASDIGLGDLLVRRVLSPLEEKDIREYWLNRRQAPVPDGLTPDTLPKTLATLGGGIPGDLAKMADCALAQSQKKDPFFEDT